MSFIEDLYYGNIRPCDKSFNKDSNYAKVLEVLTKSEKELYDTLTGTTLESFNSFADASNELSAYTGVENFKLGFILGVHFMTDCFKYESGTIFKDI